MRTRIGSRLIIEQRLDEEVQSYIQELLKGQSCFRPQTSEDNNSIGAIDELNNEPGSLLFY